MDTIKKAFTYYYVALIIVDVLYVTTNFIWVNQIKNEKIVNVDDVNQYITQHIKCSNGEAIRTFKNNHFCHFPSSLNNNYCDIEPKNFDCYGIITYQHNVYHIKECYPDFNFKDFEQKKKFMEDCAYQFFLPLTISFFIILHIGPALFGIFGCIIYCKCYYQPTENNGYQLLEE